MRLKFILSLIVMAVLFVPILGQENTGEYWVDKGISLMVEGRGSKDNSMVEKSIIYYDKALELDPKLKDAWDEKGGALLFLGRYDEAIYCYNKSIEINASDTLPWHNKGNAFLHLKNYNEALNCYDKTIEIDPSYSSGWHAKGSALYYLSRYDESIRCLDRAIELSSKLPLIMSAGYWKDKCLVLKALGRYVEADAAFAKAKELGYTG